MALPNGINFFANSAKSFSPANTLTNPPTFGTFLAISVRTLPALAVAVTAFASILPDTVDENLTIAFPNGIICSPNLSKLLLPVTNVAILSSILAAVKAVMTDTRVLTPLNDSGVIVFAPEMKGVAFTINFDKLEPISGNDEVIPFTTPPTIPPTNCPMAVPIFPKRLPPSSISQLSPGICANPPIAAKTKESSDTTSPTPITPAIAEGINPTTPDKAYINAVINPTAAIVFSKLVVSIPFNAFITPSKTFPIKFTTATIRVGTCFAKPLMTPINNTAKESTIFGVYVANEFNTS